MFSLGVPHHVSGVSYVGIRSGRDGKMQGYYRGTIGVLFWRCYGETLQVSGVLWGYLGNSGSQKHSPWVTPMRQKKRRTQVHFGREAVVGTSLIRLVPIQLHEQSPRSSTFVLVTVHDL